MKICYINLCNYGSTGSIVRQLAEIAKAKGHDVMVAYPDNFKNKPAQVGDYLIESQRYNYVSGELSTFTGFDCCFAVSATRKLLCQLDNFQPDIIHLHNIHGWYINISMLFRYIKKHNVRVVWTLHDCWAFTGHCPHFQENNCEKWKTGCHSCELHMNYPKSYLDNSKWMYAIKKHCFTGVQNMTIVTPSEWLASLVKQSFLGCYPVQVINNGIDLSVYGPSDSDFRQRFHIEDKKVVLGVASQWNNKKGLDVFIELSKRLDEMYQVVLVGTSDKTDALLPGNIISIHRTNNQQELAEVYSAADVFVNPTREDTFPTVNIEALACGTPVVTFDVGGGPEIIGRYCGSIVPKDNINELTKEIVRICTQNVFKKDNCLLQAKQYRAEEKYTEYFLFYDNLYINNMVRL